MTHPIHPAYGGCDVDRLHCSECVRITNLLAARAEAAEKAQDLLAARHLEDERRLTVAREALVSYGEHNHACTYWVWFDAQPWPQPTEGGPCSCGLDAALKDIDQ